MNVWSEETNHPNLHIPMPYTYRFFFIHDFSILSVPDEGYTRKASYSLHLISTFLLQQMTEACKHIPIQLSYKKN